MTQLPCDHRVRIVPALRLALLLALAAVGQARAGGCAVSSSGLAFGAYQPLTLTGKLTSIAVTSDASISVRCAGISSASSYTIALGPSIEGSGDRISTRYMRNIEAGGDNMSFNVYTNNSYSTVWGDGLTAGSLIGGTIPKDDSNQSQPVYGRIPAGQNTLKAGSFSDSLIMTLSFNP